MIYSDNWKQMEAQTKSVEAMIADKVRKFRLVVTKAIGRPVVWVKCGSEESMYYVVGIQGDGSIVRAEGLVKTGYPMDPRCQDGQIVIKQSDGCYTDAEKWPGEKDVEWVEAEIGGKVRKFGLLVTKVAGKDRVWIMTVADGAVFFLVGIQADGAIVRARNVGNTGLPIDPRVVNKGMLVIRKQLGGEDE